MRLQPATTDARDVYLHPGQLFAEEGSAVVTTILGSCVAVCLHDSVSGVTVVNHFLLPRNPRPGTDDARYGDTAMDLAFAAMWRRGALVHRVVAKIFGGACTLPGALSAKSIGEQNIEVARRFLDANRIYIAAAQTGGRKGRKLLFDTSDGTAWVKEL